MSKLIVIDDNNWLEHAEAHPEGRARGGKPRDYDKNPVGCYASASPFDVPLIPKDKQAAYLKAQQDHRSSLLDLRMISGPGGSFIPSRDQDGVGYCWAHSTVSATLLARAREGQPYADLSAFSVAAPIKNFKDEGGWCQLSCDWLVEHGCATSEYWPQQSRDRKYLNDEMRANAKLHRVVEFMDLDPKNMKEQMITCFLLGIPMALDFNWWSHSVCGIKLNSIDPFEIVIWNSWGDDWSEKGCGVIKGSKAVANGAVAIRTSTASNK